MKRGTPFQPLGVRMRAFSRGVMRQYIAPERVPLISQPQTPSWKGDSELPLVWEETLPAAVDAPQESNAPVPAAPTPDPASAASPGQPGTVQRAPAAPTAPPRSGGRYPASLLKLMERDQQRETDRENYRKKQIDKFNAQLADADPEKAAELSRRRGKMSVNYMDTKTLSHGEEPVQRKPEPPESGASVSSDTASVTPDTAGEEDDPDEGDSPIRPGRDPAPDVEDSPTLSAESDAALQREIEPSALPSVSPDDVPAERQFADSSLSASDEPGIAADVSSASPVSTVEPTGQGAEAVAQREVELALDVPSFNTSPDVPQSGESVLSEPSAPTEQSMPILGSESSERVPPPLAHAEPGVPSILPAAQRTPPTTVEPPAVAQRRGIDTTSAGESNSQPAMTTPEPETIPDPESPTPDLPAVSEATASAPPAVMRQSEELASSAPLAMPDAPVSGSSAETDTPAPTLSVSQPEIVQRATVDALPAVELGVQQEIAAPEQDIVTAEAAPTIDTPATGTVMREPEESAASTPPAARAALISEVNVASETPEPTLPAVAAAQPAVVQRLMTDETLSVEPGVQQEIAAPEQDIVTAEAAPPSNRLEANEPITSAPTTVMREPEESAASPSLAAPAAPISEVNVEGETPEPTLLTRAAAQPEVMQQVTAEAPSAEATSAQPEITALEPEAAPDKGTPALETPSAVGEPTISAPTVMREPEKLADSVPPAVPDMRVSEVHIADETSELNLPTMASAPPEDVQRETAGEARSVVSGVQQEVAAQESETGTNEVTPTFDAPVAGETTAPSSTQNMREPDMSVDNMSPAVPDASISESGVGSETPEPTSPVLHPEVVQRVTAETSSAEATSAQPAITAPESETVTDEATPTFDVPAVGEATAPARTAVLREPDMPADSVPSPMLDAQVSETPAEGIGAALTESVTQPEITTPKQETIPAEATPTFEVPPAAGEPVASTPTMVMRKPETSGSNVSSPMPNARVSETPAKDVPTAPTAAVTQPEVVQREMVGETPAAESAVQPESAAPEQPTLFSEVASTFEASPAMSEATAPVRTAVLREPDMPADSVPSAAPGAHVGEPTDEREVSEPTSPTLTAAQPEVIQRDMVGEPPAEESSLPQEITAPMQTVTSAEATSTFDAPPAVNERTAPVPPTVIREPEMSAASPLPAMPDATVSEETNTVSEAPAPDVLSAQPDTIQPIQSIQPVQRQPEPLGAPGAVTPAESESPRGVSETAVEPLLAVPSESSSETPSESPTFARGIGSSETMLGESAPDVESLDADSPNAAVDASETHGLDVFQAMSAAGLIARSPANADTPPDEEDSADRDMDEPEGESFFDSQQAVDVYGAMVAMGLVKGNPVQAAQQALSRRSASSSPMSTPPGSVTSNPPSVTTTAPSAQTSPVSVLSRVLDDGEPDVVKDDEVDDIDIDKLARDVYRHLKDRLRIESERGRAKF